MTEARKHAILFAATLLSARRLIENIESDKPHMNEQYFIDRAIAKAVLVLERIVAKYATTDTCCVRRDGGVTFAKSGNRTSVLLVRSTNQMN